MVQAEGDRRTKRTTSTDFTCSTGREEKCLWLPGRCRYTLGPIDVPHYNLYNAAKINGQPAPGYSSGQAIAAMERVADQVLPEGFSYEWTGTTFQEQKTGNVAA